MKCRRCEQDNPSHAKFCLECGAPCEAAGASYPELQRELTEALEQQTATAEILRVISSSPTDLQPIFDTIAQRATRLCGGLFGSVYRFDGTLVHMVAHYNYPPVALEFSQRTFPAPPSRQLFTTRAILAAAPVNVRDVQRDPDYVAHDVMRAAGFQSVLSVPMCHASTAVGAITVWHANVGGFTDKHVALLETFADQAVIAIENVRLFKELEARNRDLTEALDQQIATSEILGVISRSPTDAQPVFEAIAANAARLCSANDAQVLRVEGDSLRLIAAFGEPSMPSMRRLTRGHLVGRAVIDRATMHVRNVEQAIAEYSETTAAGYGVQSAVAVPLVRDDVALGVIRVSRREIRPFTDKQISLLKTFADQAVIAIENVRLFTELQDKNKALTQAHAQVTEALDQQTATSDILRAISASPVDVQPVFEAIARNSVRLCNGVMGAVFRFDGEFMHIGALHGFSADGEEATRRTFPTRPERRMIAARAVLSRAIVHVPDVMADPDFDYAALATTAGWRSLLVVPMLRGGEVLGTVGVGRAQIGLFRNQEVALLQTFADQAVIAIENVRLFKELEARNRDLTATSEILRVIASSPTDIQPVFDAIIENATRLCRAVNGTVFRFDGELMHVAAHHNIASEAAEVVGRVFPMPPDRGSVTGRAIVSRTVIHVPDVASDPEHMYPALLEAGFRAILAVPMLRHRAPIGAITVTRHEPEPFSDDEVELLKTFAAQAVIAIENVRLFEELEARTQELTRSVGELKALGEVGQAINSTLDLETVLTTIVSRAVALSRLDGGVVFEYDEGASEFVHRVATEVGGALAEARRTTRVRKGEGVVGQTALTLEPAQVADIIVPGAYESRLRDNLIASGIRAVLAVPMVREGELIGCLVVSRNAPGEFPAETIQLLRTFATQSALAIQNARLFREIEQKSRELEAASRHKSEFLANMSHELRTPLNAVIGFSEVLSERMFGDLNEKQDEYLKDIHTSGQHLLSLINDILDLSKIEAGKMELELSDVDVSMTIENALMLVRERAARRSIELHTAVDERVGEVQADERKIRQVLLNLLSNAIKFTPEGGRIDVGARPMNGCIEVSVSDTGVGIAPDDQEAVFEEFKQVGTVEKKVEGTGLGLALSRKFIELHGGKIWVESHVGQGSTFTFILPVRHGE